MQMVKCASSYDGEGEAASEAVNCCLRYIYIDVETCRRLVGGINLLGLQ
jgi:hypothetical protein